jgi:hypothetical protein
MPEVMIRLKPGVNVEQTPALNQAGIASSNLIRHRYGLPEKLGGWDKFFGFAVGGVPKALNAWEDLNANTYLGVGATMVLGAINNNVLISLTPQQLTSDFTPNFSTVLNSATVTILDSNVTTITPLVSIEFKTPIAVGGIILSGVYPVSLFLGAGQYQIVAAVAASSGVSNGGAVPVFTTSNGSALITVALTANGLAVGQSISFPIPTTVGGVTILGTYQCVSITDANHFVISTNSLATSSTSASMNSGNAEILYYIGLGPVSPSTGYSVSTYSSGFYSTGVAITAQTGTPITATDWTLDNWGQTFLATPENGGVYYWTPNQGLQTSVLVSGAPTYNTGMFVSMQTQMLICYGSTVKNQIGISQDPLLVAWSNVGDYTNFTVATTSLSGSRRLSTGSKIIGGMATPQQELLWTDVGVWSMNFLGTLAQGVWGFLEVGRGCGLVGKHAACRIGASVYWMSNSNFFSMVAGGIPTPMPCSVWDVVFQDLSSTYFYKSWAWANTPFNEVWFFFPRQSTGATDPDFYVKVNMDGLWDYGPLPRSCGIDVSLLGMPIAATPAGIIYQHETSPDADGQAINSWFETGYYRLSEGQDVMVVDWAFPDFIWETFAGSTSANIEITISSYSYLSSTPVVVGPYTVSKATPYFNTRIRGRFFKLRYESNDLGSFWRTGGSMFRVANDGRL